MKKNIKILATIILVIILGQTITPVANAAQNEILTNSVAEDNKQNETTENTTKEETQKDETTKIPVKFESQYLEDYFKNIYDSDGDEIITDYDMAQITTLNLVRPENIEGEISLKGLEYCTSLVELEVNGLYKDLSAIKDITTLEKIQLSGFSLTSEDTSMLTNLTNLKYLFINWSDLNNIVFAKLPKNLIGLRLSGSELRSISGIKELENLDTIDISLQASYDEDYKISGLEEINSLKNLKNLTMTGAHLKDLDFLEGNKSIESLQFEENKIKDISVLRTMSNLQLVRCKDNMIEDLSVLEELNIMYDDDYTSYIQKLQANNLSTIKGKKLEVDLPKTVQLAFDEQSKFYMENARISLEYLEKEYENYNNTLLDLNDEKSKVTLDTSNLEIGEYTACIKLLGNGKLSGTPIYFDFRVEQEAEKEKKVEFESEKLEAFFKENYDIDGDEQISEWDMAQIIELNLPWTYDSNNPESLKGLECCTSLKRLILNGYYKNLDTIKNLTELESIQITEHYFTDEEREVFANLTNLETLNIMWSNFENISLDKLPKNLKDLRLRGSSLRNISGIENLQDLETLGIYLDSFNNNDDKINSLEELNKLTKLKNLWLEGTNLYDLEFLRENTAIENLYFNSNNVKDISVLRTLTNLKHVECSNNQIEDISILEELNLIPEDTYNSYGQTIKLENRAVERNNTLEIDLPKTVQLAFDEQSRFKMKDAEVLINTLEKQEENYTRSIRGVNITINDEKSKVTLDTSELEVGKYQGSLHVSGVGLLSGTDIYFEFSIENPGNKEDIVEFESEELEQYFKNKYDADNDKVISQWDMAQIEELYLSFATEQLINLKGLEYCTSLKTLTLYGNYENLDILTQINSLEKLTLGSINLKENNSFLNNLSTSLKSLCLENIDFTETSIDILPKSIEELQFIWCYFSDISDISKFENLNYLRFLGAESKNIQGLNKINELTKLKKLEMCQMNIDSFDFLKNNETIEQLDISSNNIKDISFAQTMVNLKELICGENHIEDISIIETLNIRNQYCDYKQSFEKELTIPKGQNFEIDIPKTMRLAFDKNSAFYDEEANLKVENYLYNEALERQDEEIVISEDKTKINIATENLDAGIYRGSIILYSNSYIDRTKLEFKIVIEAEGDNTKIVEFESEELKAYLLENYDADGDKQITEYDMAQITNLDLSNMPTTTSGSPINLKGLEKCISLKSLATGYNNFSNFEVLMELENLKELYVFCNNISKEDFITICNLKNLETLVIRSASADIFSINILPKNVKSLSLYNCTIDSFSGIENFENLETLNIGGYCYGEFSQIENINNIQNLKRLTIMQNLKDIEFLRGNSKIEYLNIEYNNIKNIDVISTMSNLKEIEVDDNQIEDLSILKNLNLFKTYGNYEQHIYMEDKIAYEGQDLEIDTPQLIRDIYNTNSEFHLENIRLEEYSPDTEQNVASLNSDGTKIKLNTKNMPVGKYEMQLYIYGDGTTSGTSINLTYYVAKDADKTKEVEFESEELKQFFLKYYDIDKDERVTEFDMAQIIELRLEEVERENTDVAINIKGLEKCISLEKLEVPYNFTNLNVLKYIPNLKSLNINCWHYIKEDYDVISTLNNLEELKIYDAHSEYFTLDKLPTNLKKLELESTSIKNISNITCLTNLESLTIYYSELEELESINQLSKLRELKLQCNLDNIDFLENNQYIEKLDVSSNNITNIDVIRTMPNLKEIQASYNRIQDFSVLKELNLLSKINFLSQYVYLSNIMVQEGTIAEVDSPEILEMCFDETDELYLRNFRVDKNPESKISVSEDGNKIIIDATNLQIGDYGNEITLLGDGKLSGTQIKVQYKVVADANNTEPISFGSEKIQNYILENYDVDEDKKITAFDMAQIQNLYIPYFEGANYEDLKGLEYAISLESLAISQTVTNFEVISSLNNLIELRYNNGIQDENDYLAITSIPNLKYLTLDMVDFTKYDLNALPKSIEGLTILNSTIGNLSAISNFTNLKSLEIGSGPNEEIAGLEEINYLPNLTRLHFTGKNLNNLEWLRNNTTIEELDVNSNDITDISPILTMKNLHSLDIRYNNIENMDLLNQKEDIIENSSLMQNIEKRDIIVYRGENVEIDLPNTIRTCFDPNSKLYMEDATLNEYDYYYKNGIIRLNDDKTKLIIDATNETIGEKSAYYYISGEGRLTGTTIYVEYKVYEKADNKKEIPFGNEGLKNYILKHYDIDKDNKITAFDLAQIEYLDYREQSIESTKGLEYAKNLKNLGFSVKYNYSQENVKYDFSALAKLTNLEELRIEGKSSEITGLDKFTKLNYLVISLDSEMQDKQLEEISKLTNLRTLYLYGSSIKNADAIKKLTNLEKLSAYFGEGLTSLDGLKNLINLRDLDISVYMYGDNKKDVNYSFLNSLTNLERIEISDSSSTYIDLKNLSKLKNLNYCNISANEVKNTNYLSNLTELYYLQLDSAKISDLEFARNMQKLGNVVLKNNFITDLSPLENTNIWEIDLTNNPINEKETKNANIINKFEQEGKRIILTPYEKSQIVEFTNTKFKEYLLNNSYDLNKDGELSIFELEKIEHLYPSTMIENAEYFTGLKNLTIYSSVYTSQEQMKLIEQINLLPDETEVSIPSINLNLGYIYDASKDVDILTNCPLLNEMQREGSKIYKGKLTIQETEYDDEEKTAELKNGKLHFIEKAAGEYGYSARAISDNQKMYIYIRWKIIVPGSTTKTITIKDANLKNYILANHDIDGDKKITEYDILNLTDLSIYEQNIASLEGLENAKNLRYLYANGNKITDISPLVKIGKEKVYYDLGNNEITDISYLANSKLKTPLNLGLYDNYIDFSEGSINLKVLQADYKKDSRYDNADTVNGIICSQRIGKPSEKNREVALDANLKKKLISYGIDANNDSKITRQELYEASSNFDGRELDLSSSGIKGVSGLEYLKFYNVNLSNNEITDITPLGKNRSIGSINLSNNKITDISCFANYNNFRWGTIDFSNNQITDISSIKTWPIMKYYYYLDDEYQEPFFRNLEINLSGNNIKNISVVKDLIHISKIDLSNNKVDDISSLANYNFKTQLKESEHYDIECLDAFEGIILDNNYIDKTDANNKKAINVFSKKGVLLKLDNQKKKDVSEIFADVKKGSWYYPAVKYVYENGIMTGGEKFEPNTKVTRGMLASIIYKMEGAPQVSGKTKFTDVQDSSKYYFKAVKWAADNRVVSGYPDGRFGPTDYVTREQLAVILHNYARYKKKDVSMEADLKDFADANKVGNYAKSSVKWAVATKVITGGVDKKTGKNILNPKGQATRAEIAAMIQKYCLRVGR